MCNTVLAECCSLAQPHTPWFVSYLTHTMALPVLIPHAFTLSENQHHPFTYILCPLFDTISLFLKCNIRVVLSSSHVHGRYSFTPKPLVSPYLPHYHTRGKKPLFSYELHLRFRAILTLLLHDRPGRGVGPTISYPRQ